jgi:hypothetical protein
MRSVKHDMHGRGAFVRRHKLQRVSAIAAVRQLHRVLWQPGDVHSEPVAAFLARVALQMCFAVASGNLLPWDVRLLRATVWATVAAGCSRCAQGRVARIADCCVCYKVGLIVPRVHTAVCAWTSQVVMEGKKMLLAGRQRRGQGRQAERWLWQREVARLRITRRDLHAGRHTHHAALLREHVGEEALRSGGARGHNSKLLCCDEIRLGHLGGFPVLALGRRGLGGTGGGRT